MSSVHQVNVCNRIGTYRKNTQVYAGSINISITTTEYIMHSTKSEFG